MRKKGFTLIELLAVIVILAIVALIATPVILNMIEKARKSAFQDSAYGLIETARLQYADDILDGIYQPRTYVAPFDDLAFSGSKPSGGMITVGNDGKIAIAIHNNKWCAMKTEDQSQVTMIDYNEEICKIEGSANADTIPPILSFDDVTLKVTEVVAYHLLTGVVATDDSGKEPTITVSGSLSATIGTQIITYIATDEAGNQTIKKRTFTIVEAEGPILNFSSAGSELWTKEQSITITATDTSDIKNFTYEVFKDDVSQGVNIVDTNIDSVTVDLNTTGIYKIKLEAIDQYDNTSVLESSTYKIDVTSPKITMPTSGRYAQHEDSLISNVIFGPSGGTIDCIDQTTGSKANHVVGQLSFGSHLVRCTAISNTNISSSSEANYTIYGDYSGSNIHKLNVKDSQGFSENKIILKPDILQYGPYKHALKGRYKITYTGSGFDNTNVLFSSYENLGEVYQILNLERSNSKVTYFIEIEQNAFGRGLEVVCNNKGTSNIEITSITIEMVE